MIVIVSISSSNGKMNQSLGVGCLIARFGKRFHLTTPTTLLILLYASKVGKRRRIQRSSGNSTANRPAPFKFAMPPRYSQSSPFKFAVQRFLHKVQKISLQIEQIASDVRLWSGLDIRTTITSPHIVVFLYRVSIKVLVICL